MLSLVMYSNCFEQNISKQQVVINLSAMLLLQVLLCLLLFITVSLHYKINNDYVYTWCNICSAWFLDIRISSCFNLVLETVVIND